MTTKRTTLTGEDEATLWALALVEGTTVAEQRRRAIAAYAELARRDEQITELVRIRSAARSRLRDGADLRHGGPGRSVRGI